MKKEGIWNQILTYFYLRKRDADAPKNTNIFLMHGMNRLSLFIFLVGIVVMIIRLLRH